MVSLIYNCFRKPDIFQCCERAYKNTQIFSFSEDEKEDMNVTPCNNSQSLPCGLQVNKNKAPVSPNTSSTTVKPDPDIKVPIHALSNDPEEAYTLFMGSNNWYLFLRLHHILCERLTKMYDRAVVLAEEESKYKQQRKESAAVALRLKPKSERFVTQSIIFLRSTVIRYYNYFNGHLYLSQVKSRLRNIIPHFST